MTDFAPPKPKMPLGRALLMGAVFFTLEIIQTLCALLVVFAPILICYFAQYWVEDWTASKTAGELACWAAGTGFAASYVVGVGVGIAILGIVLSMLVSVISSLIAIAWFRYAGIPLMDRSATRLWVWLTGLLLEFIPYLNVLPFATGSMVLMILHVRKEDRKALAEYRAAHARAQNEESRSEELLAEARAIRAARAAADENSLAA